MREKENWNQLQQRVDFLLWEHLIFHFLFATENFVVIQYFIIHEKKRRMQKCMYLAFLGRSQLATRRCCGCLCFATSFFWFFVFWFVTGFFLTSFVRRCGAGGCCGRCFVLGSGRRVSLRRRFVLLLFSPFFIFLFLFSLFMWSFLSLLLRITFLFGTLFLFCLWILFLWLLVIADGTTLLHTQSHNHTQNFNFFVWFVHHRIS